MQLYNINLNCVICKVFCENQRWKVTNCMYTLISVKRFFDNLYFFVKISQLID